MKEYKDTGYYATEDGRIISMKSGIAKEIAKNVDNWGYPRVTIQINKKSTSIRVHIIVAWCYKGECPTGYQVNHEDGVKTNSHESNLEYRTPGYNQQHAYAMGLRKSGENTPMTKLSDAEWVTIARRLNAGETTRGIALEYGMSENYITAVMCGAKRKYLTDQGLISKDYIKQSFTNEEMASILLLVIRDGKDVALVAKQHNMYPSALYEVLNKKRYAGAWALIPSEYTYNKPKKLSAEYWAMLIKEVLAYNGVHGASAKVAVEHGVNAGMLRLIMNKTRRVDAWDLVESSETIPQGSRLAIVK